MMSARLSVAAITMVTAMVAMGFPVQGSILQVPSASYATIQAGINAAAAGDTVQIQSGTYRERLYIIDRRDLTIAGAGAGATILKNSDLSGDGEPPPFYVSHSTGIRIVNLTVEGGEVGAVITAGSQVSIEACLLEHFTNVGVFIGKPGCAPLPPGSLTVPPCYLPDRESHVDDSRLELHDSSVEDNGIWGISGTGLVFFPGTSGLVHNSTINANELTGVFFWGAHVDLDGCTFDANVEHAVEYRQYPSPKMKSGFILRAGGTMSGNRITNTRPLPGNSLGGGMVTQAADLNLIDNTFQSNYAWGISASNRSLLTLTGNTVSGSGQAGIIVQKGSRATLGEENVLSGNGFEGLVAQGNAFCQVGTSTISGNGRTGVLIQNNSEAHLHGTTVTGNGTSGRPFGGVAFQSESWGSVIGCAIRGHGKGPGVVYPGGSRELFVDNNTFSDNTASAVIFSGPTALGTVLGNTFQRNTPWDVGCPGGGLPFLSGPPSFNGRTDGSCGTPPPQFLVVPAATVLTVLASERVGAGKQLADIIGAADPIVAARTLTNASGVTGLLASPAAAKNWYFPGGSTLAGGETSLVVFNPGAAAVTATVTFYPENGSAVTATRNIRARKKITVNASPFVGSGLLFSAKVAASSPVAAEQRITTSAGASAGEGSSAAAATWYIPIAEVGGGCATSLSFHNPGSIAAMVSLTYLLEQGGTVKRNHQIPAGAGKTFAASADLGAYQGPFAVAAVSDQPLFAASLTSGPAGVYGGPGLALAGRSWDLPRGNTTDGRETWIYLANPGSDPVQATLTFRAGNPGSEIAKALSLTAESVTRIRASDEVSGQEFAVSVTADGPVLVGESVEKDGTDISSEAGSPVPVYSSYLADGSTSSGAETAIRLYNPGAEPVSVRLRMCTSR